MNKVDQMWYLLLICHDFATVVIPFFRAVLVKLSRSVRSSFVGFVSVADKSFLRRW